jgi:hypothetical protein
MPTLQPAMELIGTQVEELHERQQQLCRAFEGCPDDLDVIAPMETNSYTISKQQVLYTISSLLH